MATADNRAYLASVLRTFAQIPRFARNFRYAQPLGEIGHLLLREIDNNMEKIFLEKNVIDSMNPTSKGTILRSIAIFTAIELCGSCLTGKTGSGNTNSNFLKFITSNYMSNKYHEISDLLYKIFRNGVHHSYIAKGGALLTSNESLKNDHLKFFTRGLLIHVPTFANDVSRAVEALAFDIKTSPKMQKNYKDILDKTYNDGIKIYNDYLNKLKIVPIDKLFSSDMKF